MIIGICGFANSGKDTIANILIEKYDFHKLSFASILKDIVSKIFDWDRKLLEGDTKESREWRETKDEWWSIKLGKEITPRWVLQNIGTDIMRNNFHQNIWILALEKQLDKYDKVVITDCRFPNEIEMIKTKGGIMVNVTRDTNPSWYDDYFYHNIKPPSEIHESEYSWIQYFYEYVIENKKDINYLEKQVHSFMNSVLV